MAHVYCLRLCTGKIGFCYNSFHCIQVPKQNSAVRKLYVSACKLKFPEEKVNSKTELDTENDLDYFGLHHFDKQNPKPPKSISKSQKKSAEKIVEKYLLESNESKANANIEMTGYGSIRYDDSIPESQKSNRLSRKQRRLQSGTTATDSNTFPKLLALHNEKKEEKKEDSLDNSHLSPKENFGNKVNRNQTIENDVLFSTNSRNVKSNETMTIDNNNVSKTLVSPEPEMSFIDEQYFCNNDSDETNLLQHSENKPTEKLIESDRMPVNETGCHETENLAKTESAEKMFNEQQDLSYVDEQFFGNYDHNSTYKSSEFKKMTIQKNDLVEKPTKSKRPEISSKKDQDLGFVDEQYFDCNHVSSDTVPHENKGEQNFNQLPRHRNERSNQSEAIKTMKKDVELKLDNEKSPKNLKNENHSIENSQSVYAASMKIRKELEKKRGSNLVGTYDPKEYDSAGFRILKNQVPHFDNAPSIDVIKVLRKSIIYDDNEILAISKPYGVPSYDGPDNSHSVGDYLDEIIPDTKLYPVHRLDKETTGVILFAKTEEMQHRLKERFYSREIVKKYLVITKNIPELPNGEIDIPITEGTVEGKVRMCLRPYSNPEFAAIAKKRQPGKIAITKYKVLDQGQKCALLECFPLTGKKHQIRVHLAFGLNCPILGDHKYSHINKIAPMQLHPEILHKLHIQQSKVRYLAMHLHARSIMIPEFLDGKNLFIRAPVPPHFVRNMRDLKLKFPKHV